MLISLSKLIARLPLAWVHAIGGFAGLLVYALSATYRRRLRANLAQAGFDPQRLALACAREAGKQALETPWVWLRPAPELRTVIDVADPAPERAAIDSGKPVIYLTPHLGCFEICAQYCALNHWAPPPRADGAVPHSQAGGVAHAGRVRPHAQRCGAGTG